MVTLIETLYLAHGDPEEIGRLAEGLRNIRRDPRLSASTAVAMALAAHAVGRCSGECVRAGEELTFWESRGARFVAATGEVQIAPLQVEHDPSNIPAVVRALTVADRSGALPSLRWWSRGLADHAGLLAHEPGGLHVLLKLAHADPGFWLPALIVLLPGMDQAERNDVLNAVRLDGSPSMAGALAAIPGNDVSGLRRTMLRDSAERLHIRAFGPLTVHRGSWSGPEIRIQKKRLRHLLGLLVVSQHRGLTREMALETLWPDAALDGGVNSLNQAMFHLQEIARWRIPRPRQAAVHS